MTICHVDRRIKGKLSITDDLSVNGHISGTDASLTNLTVNGTFSSGTFSGLSSTDDVTFNSLDTEFVTLKYQVSDASSGTLNFESNVAKLNSAGGIEYFYDATISQIKSVVQDNAGGQLHFFTRTIDGSLNSTFQINNNGSIDCSGETLFDGGGRQSTDRTAASPVDPSDVPQVHIISKYSAFNRAFNDDSPLENIKNRIALRLDGNMEIYSDNWATDGDPYKYHGAIKIQGIEGLSNTGDLEELLIGHNEIQVRKIDASGTYTPSLLGLNAGGGRLLVGGDASFNNVEVTGTSTFDNQANFNNISTFNENMFVTDKNLVFNAGGYKSNMQCGVFNGNISTGHVIKTLAYELPNGWNALHFRIYYAVCHSGLSQPNGSGTAYGVVYLYGNSNSGSGLNYNLVKTDKRGNHNQINFKVFRNANSDANFGTLDIKYLCSNSNSVRLSCMIQVMGASCKFL